MTLDEWLNSQITPGKMARELEISSSYLTHIRRGVKPGQKLMERIKEYTKGAVTPEDFKREKST